MQSQFSTVEEALNQLVNGGYIIAPTHTKHHLWLLLMVP